MQKTLIIHPDDNLVVALKDLYTGEIVGWQNGCVSLVTAVKAKHKFTRELIPTGGIVTLYGVPVGKAIRPIQKGEAVTVDNIIHYATAARLDDEGAAYRWFEPDISAWRERSFKGIVRADGRVGTANFWLIIPLVFCENRNAQKLREALEKPLGYTQLRFDALTRSLLGKPLLQPAPSESRPFPNVDGIRALTVNSGCGGTAGDARMLCRVLAAYADHPNVAGITVFGLGCEKAQASLFEQELNARNPNFDKPYLFYRQQDWSSEGEMMEQAIRDTFEALKTADQVRRQAVPLSKLKVGLKCGGSDGFSGISANPSMGLVSDKIVALGGASGLAEFPELCGVEGDLVARCSTRQNKERFVALMAAYEERARLDGTSIADNPSPGNIRDGLITDAIKSAGAAQKSGTAPIAAVLDYGEPMPDSGLSLVCTPGNDLEAVTGLVAAGANLIIFSTGLGTPTGNAIVPVLKISTNSQTARKLCDMIDFDCGPVIDGTPLAVIGDQLFERVIAAASRDYTVKADRLEQYDFLFWKRELSL